MLALDREVEGSEAIVANRRSFRPVLQKRFAEDEVAVRRRLMERRPPARLGCVRISASIEQEYRNLGLLTGGRAVKRGDVTQGRVRRPRLDVRATVEQEGSCVRPAEVRGKVERAEAVGGVGVRALRTATERPAECLGIPDG